jgi:hypothetical protein
MHPRATSDPPRNSREKTETSVTALERRICALEQLAASQGHELRIRFERIARLQAGWDILRIRFIKS